MVIVGNDSYQEHLKEALTDGYVGAFKSLFEEEKKKREETEEVLRQVILSSRAAINDLLIKVELLEKRLADEEAQFDNIN